MGAFFAINFGIVSPNKKVMTATTKEERTEMAEWSIFDPKNSMNNVVANVEIPMATTLLPIKAVIKVES